MVGAILGSTKREPLVVGKPSTFMMDYLANEYGTSLSTIIPVILALSSFLAFWIIVF